MPGDSCNDGGSKTDFTYVTERTPFRGAGGQAEGGIASSQAPGWLVKYEHLDI